MATNIKNVDLMVDFKDHNMYLGMYVRLFIPREAFTPLFNLKPKYREL